MDTHTAPKYNIREYLFKWVQVTASFEVTDTDQIGRLYVNGRLVDTTHNMGTGQKIDTNVQIGAISSIVATDKLHYTGLMDEVRFFK